MRQEDFCQATGVPPDKKYQEDGRPSLARIAGILQAVAPATDVEALLRAVVLTILSGNGDAHAKNFSLWHHPSGALGLAPLYDLMSTLHYGDACTWTSARSTAIRTQSWPACWPQAPGPPTSARPATRAGMCWPTPKATSSACSAAGFPPSDRPAGDRPRLGVRSVLQVHERVIRPGHGCPDLERPLPWPRRPELAAVLGRWRQSQLARAADGSSGS